jgi:hypothetical protein
MADNTAEERRRLSAAWLNIVAAGLVSAGVAHSLFWVAAEGWGERAARLLALGTGYVLGGFGLHTVWCSIWTFSSAPTRTMMLESHIQVMNPMTAPRDP